MKLQKYQNLTSIQSRSNGYTMEIRRMVVSKLEPLKLMHVELILKAALATEAHVRWGFCRAKGL